MKFRAFVLSFLTLSSLFLLTSHSEASSKTKVGTFDCELALPNQTTDSFLITCGDGNEMLRGIKWSKWSSAGASGVGVYSWNDCKPYCASGKFHSLSVKVTLNRARLLKNNLYLTQLAWSQIDRNKRVVPGGISGTLNLLKNFQQMGGEL
jgi:hypothetical protein